MDTSYSTSNFQGYSDHLPTVKVVLPLKYPVGSSAASSPNESFHNQLSDSGNLIDLSDANTLLDYVSYDVLNDLKTITLVPIASKKKVLDFSYQNISLKLPHPLISTSCLNVNYHDDSIIINLIDSSYLFITVKVTLSNFEKSMQRLSLDNLTEWGHISVPYSFELRSTPYYLKAIDQLNILVSLKDGGLLHLQRPHVLAEFDVYTFNETSAMIPLNFIGGLFKRKAHTHNNAVLDGVSSNTLVDVVKLSEDTFVALTVNKLIKFWNLRSHQQVLSPINLNEYTADLSTSWLNTIPTKYLKVFTIADRTLLTFYVNSNTKKENSSGFVFKTWEMHDLDTLFHVKELDFLSFEPELPSLFFKESTISSTFQNNLWFIQDYQIEFKRDELLYYLLWKSNTSSILVTYVINLENGSVAARNWSHIGNQSPQSVEFSPHFDISYYHNKIFNSGRYDELIVRTSLDVIKTHLKIPGKSDRKSIRESVQEIINLQQDPKSCWFNLYSLCEEYKKLSEESMAMILTNKPYILSLQANGLGIFRPSHYYESFAYQRKENTEGKLAAILFKVQQLLSTKTYQKLTEVISHQKHLTEIEATEIFEACLSTKISSEDTFSIISQLESLNNVVDVINSLIDSTEDFELIEEVESSTPETEHIGLLSILNTLTAFKEIKSQHESVLNNLVILLLICDVNKQTLQIVNHLLAKLQSYKLISYVFDTSFKSLESTSRIEDENLNKLENSLFWSGIVHKHPHLRYLIQESKLNQAYDYFYKIIANNDNFVIDVVINLIDRGEGEYIQNTFLSSLKTGEVIERFLIGLVYLSTNQSEQFYKTFEDFEFFKFDESIKAKLAGLTANPILKKFLDSIFTVQSNELLQKANYFHSLSELAKEQAQNNRRLAKHPKFQGTFITAKTTTAISEIEIEFGNTALKFESRAIDHLKQITHPSSSVLILIDQYYLNIFELSMLLTNYDLIYDTLSNLYVHESPSHYDYRELFTRFINKLIINRSTPILFAPNQNKLYHKNYLRIDSILLELANNELTLSNALRYYEYLYSWRLFGSANELNSSQLVDKRGAIEALYMFIARFKIENGSNLIEYSEKSIEDLKQYKLKILELYMIILNCLKSFEHDDDKWLMKAKDESSMKVVTVDEIKIEYYEWLKELENELREF